MHDLIILGLGTKLGNFSLPRFPPTFLLLFFSFSLFYLYTLILIISWSLFDRPNIFIQFIFIITITYQFKLLKRLNWQNAFSISLFSTELTPTHSIYFIIPFYWYYLHQTHVFKVMLYLFLYIFLYNLFDYSTRFFFSTIILLSYPTPLPLPLISPHTSQTQTHRHTIFSKAKNILSK